LPLDPKTHVSMILRQNVLRQCFEQYTRIYESRNDCIEIASRLSLDAEHDLYRHSSSSKVYRSTAVNVIHKLKKTGPTNQFPDTIKSKHGKTTGQTTRFSKYLTHMWITFRISLVVLDYRKALAHVLPLRELYRNDFPLDLVFSEIEVVRYERVSDNLPRPISGTCQNRCDRCGNFYDVSQQPESEKCIYHPNKAHVDLPFGNQMGEKTRTHSCCGRAFGSLGCARGPHVFSISRFVELKEKYVFLSSLPFPGDFEADQSDRLKCLALDCEMVGDQANQAQFPGSFA
jgi:hypothetical protein